MSGALWQQAWSTLRADRLAMTCTALLGVLVAAAVAGPPLLEYRADEIDWAHMAVPPLAADGHWLGTDELGRGLCQSPDHHGVMIGAWRSTQKLL